MRVPRAETGSSGGSAWGDRTWPEIDKALSDGAVVVLPVGAVEPHGPHLPVIADVLIAEEMANRAAARLNSDGIATLVLPPVAYTVADWSAGFAGGVSLTEQTARAVLREILVSAASSGARCVALANAHLEPAHVACVRQACEEAAERTGRPPVFPDVTRRSLAGRLGDAFRAGDHAGRYETSLVMAVRPDLVREDLRQGLAPSDVSLVRKIREGAASFREAGMTEAYSGDPAAASAEEGERWFDVLAEVLAEAVSESLRDVSND